MAIASGALYAPPVSSVDDVLTRQIDRPRTLVQPPQSTRGMNVLMWSLLVLKVVAGAVFAGLHGRRGELEPVPERESSPRGR